MKSSMRRKEFIDLILDSISDYFDIYHNYWFENHKFVIYAYCYNRHNKYESATQESRLWEMKSFEHLFFINSDNLDMVLFSRSLVFRSEFATKFRGIYIYIFSCFLIISLFFSLFYIILFFR